MSCNAYSLTGLAEDGSPLRYVLSGDRLSIGRQGDIVLPQASISRNHALLERCGGGWTISDMGSRNGTTVNGISVQRRALSNGDIVGFGRIKFRFDAEVEGDGAEDCETCAMTMIPPSVAVGEGAVALVGRSEALRSAMQTARRAAKSNATVLISGESGTGKELFARLVYEASGRRGKPFIPVHSSAIEPTLLGSTLFGHEKGSFTGAVAQKKGLFEEADGGTIFLDEIGELSPDMQVKLLRVLQEGEFMRVGGTMPIRVDVRVICATNRNLAEAVKEGKFREDLYYRLNVIEIVLPPLRERAGDVPDLVRHFVDILGGRVRSVSDEAIAALSAYSWPGNVRELRNVVERALVLSDRDRLEIGDFPPAVAVSSPAPQSASAKTAAESPSTSAPHPTTSLAEMERSHIMSVLESCGGNKKLAADRLGISRSTLYEKLKEAGLPCAGTAHGASGFGTDGASGAAKCG